MLFQTVLASFLIASSSLVAAKTHDIVVGGGIGKQHLTFRPNNVDAEVGDVLRFVFHDGKSSVTESQFTKPCTPLKGGFDSGM